MIYYGDTVSISNKACQEKNRMENNPSLRCGGNGNDTQIIISHKASQERKENLWCKTFYPVAVFHTTG